jgi:hypothetical protein
VKAAPANAVTSDTAPPMRSLMQRLVLSLAENLDILKSLDVQTVRDLKVAAAKIRRDAKGKSVSVDQRQLALDLREAMRYRSKSTRRPCKYPYAAVEEARKMRKHQFSYREIAEALSEQYGVKVPLFTVRSWIENHSRIRN